LALLARAVAIREKINGPDSLEVAAALEQIAEIHSNRETLASAEAALKRAIAIRDKINLPKDTQLPGLLWYLTKIHGDRRNYAEAEPLARRAVSIIEKNLGPDDPIFASYLGVLAKIAWELEHHAEAESLLRRTLPILAKDPKNNVRELSANMQTLTEIFNRQGRPDEAKAMNDRYSDLIAKNWPQPQWENGEGAFPSISGPTPVGNTPLSDVLRPFSKGPAKKLPGSPIDPGVKKTSGADQNPVFPPPSPT